MKYLLLLALFISVQGHAQTKSFIIGPKGDTLNRVDLKGMKQGPWVIHENALRGEPGSDEQGYFLNDRKEGVWRRFSLDGDLIAVESFSFGMKNGRCQYFTNAGEPLREESWRAIDPKSPYDTVQIRDVNDPSKVVRLQVVKVEPDSYKNGTWTYYNTITGGIEKTEEWVMNNLKTTPTEDGDLAPIDPADGTATTAKKEEKKAPKPQAILDYEKKNSGKKKIKVRDGSTGG